MKSRSWSYTVTISNFGAQNAYGVAIRNTLPPFTSFLNAAFYFVGFNGLPVASATNYSLEVVDEGEVEYHFDHLKPFSQERAQVRVDAVINPGSCSIPPQRNSFVGEWGCGGRVQERTTLNDTRFVFLPASIVVSLCIFGGTTLSPQSNRGNNRHNNCSFLLSLNP